jgi:hypothetical protein
VKIHVRTTVREDHQLKIKSLIKLVESGGKTPLSLGMQPKPTRGANMLPVSSAIKFGCICIRRYFRPKGNASYTHEEISHFRSLSGSITMLIKLICQVSLVLVLPLMFMILLYLM